jgi:hypothetical protein
MGSLGQAGIGLLKASRGDGGDPSGFVADVSVVDCAYGC